MFGTLLHDENAIEPVAWIEYLRCFRHAETIRATCDEYRAGASTDLVHDRADLSHKVRVPMLVLWGPTAGRGAAMTSSRCGATMSATWAATASTAATLSQEQPDQVYAALKDFFSA
jgi:haloacetate dehalogenase